MSRDAATASATASDLRARLPEAARISVIGLFILALGATLYLASELFLPIFLALFLGIILYPAVSTLRSIGFPDWLGAFVVVAGLTGFTALTLFQLSDPITYWVDELPEIGRKLERELWGLRQSIEQASEATEKLKQMAKPGGGDEAEVVVKEPTLLRELASYTWLTLAQMLMTIGLLYMLLAQGRGAIRASMRQIENRIHFTAFMEEIQSRFSAYIRSITVINLGVGLLTGIAMLLLGLPNPVMWGLLAFFLNFLPFVGPLTMMAVLALAGLASFENWYMMLAAPAAFAAINAVECYAVTPVVLGRTMTLNPVFVFLSMLFWTWCWGMPGAFLAAPIAVFAKLAYDFSTGNMGTIAEQARSHTRNERQAVVRPEVE